MKKTALCAAALFVLALSLEALAHEEMHLPPGPIKDRHELMENIGDNAKKIGDALKAKDVKAIPAAAHTIAADAAKINALFPAGSTDPKSRALPAIWQDFPKFEKLSADLGTSAEALAKAAEDPAGDPGAAAKTMFGNCKACHDAFRKPDEKEKK